MWEGKRKQTEAVVSRGAGQVKKFRKKKKFLHFLKRLIHQEGIGRIEETE